MSILTVRCADQPGLVAATAAAIHECGGNIVDADQHTDRVHDLFLQRIEIEFTAADATRFRQEFDVVAQQHSMEWTLHDNERPRLVVLVSQEAHCLYDLLSRHALGELGADIEAVISNHPDHETAATRFGLRFEHLPVDPEDREAQQQLLLQRLTDIDPDLVVMACYMQILPPSIIDAFTSRIINIHHSFLPAFAGSKPYHRAFERGVKIIGATAHYATEELDEGPIISQQVTNVSHRDEVEDLIRRGRDLEKMVLADAVRKHIERRVVTYANRTVVFG